MNILNEILEEMKPRIMSSVKAQVNHMVELELLADVQSKVDDAVEKHLSKVLGNADIEGSVTAAITDAVENIDVESIVEDQVEDLDITSTAENAVTERAESVVEEAMEEIVDSLVRDNRFEIETGIRAQVSKMVESMLGLGEPDTATVSAAPKLETIPSGI